MLLGCIGDDFTGSSDLGNTLTKAGMRTTQYVGIPAGPAAADVEAGIVALKSRSIPANEAISLSLAALEWLRAQGCTQFLFKYCSTFDSTPDGNIGPVAEALADALDATRVIVCPAFPATGRSVFMGHLFVNDRLLSESGMEAHPLTPMTDPDLRRWLAHQCKGDVGHVPAGDVFAGPDAVRARLDREHDKGRRLIVADAIRDEDLEVLGQAAADLPLLTGGSGIALGLPGNFRRKGQLAPHAPHWSGQDGKAAILSGSCSIATRRQIAEHAKSHPVREITADALMDGSESAKDLAEWLMANDGVPLVYSSADPAAVAAAQERYGRETIAAKVENCFAEIARQVTARGVTRLIIAGGETSGAVTEGLSLDTLAIGPEIDPGVPALRARPNLTLALKSGNFGADNFFAKSAAVLAGDRHG